MKKFTLSAVSRFFGTVACGATVVAASVFGFEAKPSLALTAEGVPISCAGPTLLVHNVATVKFVGSAAELRCASARDNMIAARNSKNTFSTLRKHPGNGLWMVCAMSEPSSQSMGLCPSGGTYLFTLVSNSSSEEVAQNAFDRFMHPVTTGRQHLRLLVD